MRIAIVEDNARDRDRIADLTRQILGEMGAVCQITAFADGDELLESYSADWDLIFLDIEMARLDGMTAAEKIRRLDQDVLIVFITNMAQYAIKGYSVHVLDFLLKPVNVRLLSQLLLRAERIVKARQRKFITLPTPKGMTRVSVAEIYYVEVANHTLSVVTASGSFRLRGTISGIEELLKESNFFRCNNCYLVNLAQVSHLENGLVVVGGHELAISRPRQKNFMEALTKYIVGGERHV